MELKEESHFIVLHIRCCQHCKSKSTKQPTLQNNLLCLLALLCKWVVFKYMYFHLLIVIRYVLKLHPCATCRLGNCFRDCRVARFQNVVSNRKLFQNLPSRASLNYLYSTGFRNRVLLYFNSPKWLQTNTVCPPSKQFLNKFSLESTFRLVIVFVLIKSVLLKHILITNSKTHRLHLL